jgi:hypothetical protein
VDVVGGGEDVDDVETDVDEVEDAFGTENGRGNSKISTIFELPKNILFLEDVDASPHTATLKVITNHKLDVILSTSTTNENEEPSGVPPNATISPIDDDASQ